MWKVWYIFKALWLVIKNGFNISKAERELSDRLREERVKMKLLEKRILGK